MKEYYLSLTKDNWDDFEKLFGSRGACGGCWCMWWRLRAKDFESQKGEGNRKAMKKLVDSGIVPGIIAYEDDTPVGWCSAAPRSDFPRLENSRILKPVDDKPVWSIACLFVAKEKRRKGISVKLLNYAADYVKKNGGKIVEGYAVEPKKGNMPDPFVFHGLYSAYIKAGFEEVVRRSETRPIMRRVVR